MPTVNDTVSVVQPDGTVLEANRAEVNGRFVDLRGGRATPLLTVDGDVVSGSGVFRPPEPDPDQAWSRLLIVARQAADDRGHGLQRLDADADVADAPPLATGEQVLHHLGGGADEQGGLERLQGEAEGTSTVASPCRSSVSRTSNAHLQPIVERFMAS